LAPKQQCKIISGKLRLAAKFVELCHLFRWHGHQRADKKWNDAPSPPVAIYDAVHFC